MENNEIVLDDLTRDLFGIPDSIHGEMLIDWLKREVEIIKNKLINRGYKDVGNHGFGMIYFSKDRFTYAIWPEDQENCQYGISKIEGFRYSQDSIQQHVFHHYGNYGYLDTFLDLVDKDEWNWIEEIIKDLSTLYKKHGHNRFFTAYDIFNKSV